MGSFTILQVVELKFCWKKRGMSSPGVFPDKEIPADVSGRVAATSDILWRWSYTLPESNIAPENRLSQEETTIRTTIFQVLC